LDFCSSVAAFRARS